MPKSIWNGYIVFGLVNIPIKLYSAIESKATSFKLLHTEDNGSIHNKRVCATCKKEVAWEDTVKGFEITKGEYLILSKQELEAIKPEKTKNLEIVEFVDAKQLDPIHFNSHYYIGPQKERERAYFLFKEVLVSSAKMAIGRFTMREKQYICAIESYNEGLLLTTLNYSYEIRNIGEIEELKGKPKLKEEELKLAKELINRLYQSEFNITEFKDSFADELKSIVKKKGKGETVTVEEIPQEVVKREKNLVEALKASLR